MKSESRIIFVLFLFIFILIFSVNHNLQELKERQSELESNQFKMQENYKEGLNQLNKTFTYYEEKLIKLNSNVQQNNATISELFTNQENLNYSLSKTNLELTKLKNNITELSEQVERLQLEIDYIKQMNSLPVDIASLFAESKEVSDDDLFRLIVSSNITAGGQYYFVDIKYTVLNISKFNEFAETIKHLIPSHSYERNKYDCDDFAWATYSAVRNYFGSIAFGVAYTHRHAFNWVIFHDKDKLLLYIVEPQTGEIFKIRDVKEIYQRWWFIHA